MTTTACTSEQSHATPSQLMALHSLFRAYAARFLGGTNIERRERMAWASDIVGRKLESFSALRNKEAARLIEFMKRALGQEISRAIPNFYRRPGGRPDRDQAQAYGTHGRRDRSSNEIRLVDAPTLALLETLLVQLGWTTERLDAFLKSRSSPVPSGAIRTLAEANRVIWALRNMIRRSAAAAAPSSLSNLSFDFARQREEG